jgi:hypothetical protein
MLVTAFYTCYGLLYLEMKRLKYDTEIASDIIFWSAVGGVLGIKDPTENALENIEIQQKSEVDPVARTPKQADWFKRWVDKFIELIDD